MSLEFLLRKTTLAATLTLAACAPFREFATSVGGVPESYFNKSEQPNSREGGVLDNISFSDLVSVGLKVAALRVPGLNIDERAGLVGGALLADKIGDHEQAKETADYLSSAISDQRNPNGAQQDKTINPLMLDLEDFDVYGNKIVFSYNIRKIPKTEKSNLEIFSMNNDGTQLRRITFTKELILDQNPKWSRDGKRFAFYELDFSEFPKFFPGDRGTGSEASDVAITFGILERANRRVYIVNSEDGVKQGFDLPVIYSSDGDKHFAGNLVGWDKESNSVILRFADFDEFKRLFNAGKIRFTNGSYPYPSELDHFYLFDLDKLEIRGNGITPQKVVPVN